MRAPVKVDAVAHKDKSGEEREGRTGESMIKIGVGKRERDGLERA